LDLSDLAFAWMVDKCDSRLTFRPLKRLVNELRTKSVHRIDPKPPVPKNETEAQKMKEEEEKDEKECPTGRWGMSKVHDEFHTPEFVGAGWLTRTPGQYFLNMKEEYLTHESIHASVRLRMQKDPKWKPEALAGFVLKREKFKRMEYQENGEPYPTTRGGRWYWEKEVVLKDKKTKKVIRLNEDMLGTMEKMLLGEDTDEGALDAATIVNDGDSVEKLRERGLGVVTPKVQSTEEILAYAAVNAVAKTPVYVVKTAASAIASAPGAVWSGATATFSWVSKNVFGSGKKQKTA